MKGIGIAFLTVLTGVERGRPFAEPVAGPDQPARPMPGPGGGDGHHGFASQPVSSQRQPSSSLPR